MDARPPLPLTAIGWKAHAALSRARGRARVVARLTTSVYLDAGGTVVWLGATGTMLHPRAMLGDHRDDSRSDTVDIDVAGIVPWRAAPVDVTSRAHADLAAGCRAVQDAIVATDAPRGLGALLAAGGAQASSAADMRDVLRRATPHCRALSRACITDDPDAAVTSAIPLLGLGAGLTPSGDDFVGGAFFARAIVAAGDARWIDAGARVVDRARDLTHPLSVELLADLAAGHSYAALHEIAAAIATSDATAALAAARRLVRLGHSSGWDMLAGFVSALVDL